jgi:hypothetical protein
MNGGAGNDRLIGSSRTDVLNGGGDDDRLEGIAARFEGGDGNDVLVVTIDGPTAPSIYGGSSDTSFTDTGSNDRLYLTLSTEPDRLTVTSGGSKHLLLDLNGVSRSVRGIEKLFVDGRAGADTFVVGELNGSGLTDITFDLGRRVTVNGVRTEATGGGFSREVPNEVTTDDGAADTITVLGSALADTVTLAYTDQSCDGGAYTSGCKRAHDLRVERSSSAGTYRIWIGQSVRAEGDRLVVEALAGNDELNASGMGTAGNASTDRIALTLRGGLGDDVLRGTPFDDVLDGGHAGQVQGPDGNDTFTGGLGRDTFFDGGGTDTLVEQFDGDLGLYDNRFVTGTVAANGVDFAAGATVEDLKGIFERAQLTGHAARNVVLIGDADGTLLIGTPGAPGFASVGVSGWSGTASVRTLDGDDLVRVELRNADGARISVDAGTGADRLEVYGTSLRDNVLVDVQGGKGWIRTRRDTETADDGATANDLVAVDHTGITEVHLATRDAGDRVAVRRTGTGVRHTVDLGAGDDVLAVGTNAGLSATRVTWPNTGGNVNSIGAAVVVLGGGGLDRMTVDDTGDSLASTGPTAGELWSDLLKGLGLHADGIAYTGLEDLRIGLGSGSDTFTVTARTARSASRRAPTRPA